MFNYIIIGAGLAGSVIAERIASSLNKEILLIEQRSNTGGNCYDYSDNNGIIIHKYGPHLFHTDSKEVFEYLSNFTEWRVYHHKVMAFVDGKKIPIPFNLNSLRLAFPETIAKRIESKLLKEFNYGDKIPVLELRKSLDTDLKALSNFVYEKIFLNYTIKQWGRKPEEIDSSVTARVPLCITREDGYFTDKYQAVPLEGYSKMFEQMLHNSKMKILLKTHHSKLIKIDLKNKKIYFDGNEFKGRLIYTGMIDELFDYRFGKLPYRSLEFKLETLNKEYFQEVAVVNYPNDYEFTRITEFKHIHPVDVKKTTIAKEYSLDYRKGRIPSYPLFDKSGQETYCKYLESSKDFKNLILLGRLAEYRYYDMDDIAKRALEVFEERIK